MRTFKVVAAAGSVIAGLSLAACSSAGGAGTSPTTAPTTTSSTVVAGTQSADQLCARLSGDIENLSHIQLNSANDLGSAVGQLANDVQGIQATLDQMKQLVNSAASSTTVSTQRNGQLQPVIDAFQNVLNDVRAVISQAQAGNFGNARSAFDRISPDLSTARQRASNANLTQCANTPSTTTSTSTR